MAVAFTLLFVTLHIAAMRNEILRRRVRSLHDDAGQPEGRHDDDARPPRVFIIDAYAVAARGRDR